MSRQPSRPVFQPSKHLPPNLRITRVRGRLAANLSEAQKSPDCTRLPRRPRRHSADNGQIPNPQARSQNSDRMLNQPVLPQTKAMAEGETSGNNSQSTTTTKQQQPWLWLVGLFCLLILLTAIANLWNR
ncbi:MAG: hypothetical protein AAFQ41_03730 [Cyanobacteria bacterium J06623_7]